ncbi:hypothetical protein [Algoriphagus sp. AK58]|uniref:hypothetical protein n=1 Tax=Algoriphagus sp. AK58 TaxID=1406877 RepID=UPI00164FC0E6|nr:hypothetical protein [Algoriphagus sp. AK58]MBC6367787.1 hypothetical protein [Algoriphagus sp. AK58]
MKINSLFRLYALWMALSLILFSCEKDPDAIVPEPDLSLVEDEFKVNTALEDLDNLTLNAMEASGLGFRVTAISNGSICPTAKLTHDPATKKITVDFGSGCTSNGVTRKGKVIFTYTGSFLIPGSSVVTTFEGYEVNGLKVEGTRTITNTGINLQNFEITLAVKVQNAKITWTDGRSSTFNTDQIRKVSLTASGYQASVTGTGNGTSRGGTSYTAAISDPLIVTQSCVESGIWIPNKGKINFSYQSIVVTVDYGFGDCDKKLEITYPGGVKEVVLD